MVRLSGLTFYRQDCDVLDAIKKEFPNQSQSYIKKELSNRWKTLSRMEKAKYMDKAREAKQENATPINDLECEEVPPRILPQIQKVELEEIEENYIRPCIYLDRHNDLEKKIVELQEDIKHLRCLFQAI